MPILNSVVQYEGKFSNEIFWKPILSVPGIQELGFTIEDDTQSTKWIYMLNRMDKITKKRVGCGWVLTGNGTSIFRKALNVTDLQIQLDQCAAVFDKTFLETARKKGYDINNLEDTQIETILVDLTKDAAARDLVRILFFGDTASANADYNQLDGVFKVLAAGIATDGIFSSGPIADTLTANTAVDELRELYFGSDINLREIDDNQKRFFVSRSIYDNYLQWLQSNNQLESNYQAIQNGIRTLTYQGVPLVKMNFWDKYITADFSPGTPANPDRPHRIIYTLPENHVIGLDTVGDASAVEFWYERKDDMNYERVRYKLGYMYRHPELIAVGGLL